MSDDNATDIVEAVEIVETVRDYSDVVERIDKISDTDHLVVCFDNTTFRVGDPADIPAVLAQLGK